MRDSGLTRPRSGTTLAKSARQRRITASAASINSDTGNFLSRFRFGEGVTGIRGHHPCSVPSVSRQDGYGKRPLESMSRRGSKELMIGT